MSDLLAIGASGLRAYRASLAATSDNVANAQTPGYARRSVRLSEVTISSAPDFRYRNRERFDGVDVAATVRAADTWRTSDARLAASAEARSATYARWMDTAEAALPDGETGTGASLAQMFSAGDRLAADPSSRVARSGFLAALDEAAGSIRGNAEELARVASGVAGAAQSAATALNADLAALADVNLAIRRTGIGTTANAELSDQRDRLIDAIAGATDVDVAVNADGSARLTKGGAVLVDLGTAATIAAVVAPDGRVSFTQSFGGATTALAPLSGSLSGLARAADTVADRRVALDTLATDLASALNTWHANGRTPGGANGAALLDATGGAAALTALVGDPAQVAAADAGGTANGNALALAGVRTGSATESQWAALVAAQAQTTASARADETRTSARRQTADAARDAVEGVDLDREAADLVRFQQAYEASARVIQMAKETVDTILRLF